MTKDEVAESLDEIGTLLELKGENAFRCNAYHNAARAIQQFDGDLKQLVAEQRLGEIRGIGETLQDKISTLVATGRLPFLDELRSSIPAGMVEMLRIPGLGPKKIVTLRDGLNIESLASLKAACEKGDVARLKGFGAKTQQKILEGITFLGQAGQRVRIDKALLLGMTLLEQIRQMPGVLRCELCGSLRRRRDTIGDIDILVSSAAAQPIMDAFIKLPEAVAVVNHGPTKSSITAVLHTGGEKVSLNADLRVVSEQQYPFALLYFTGSKEHNIRLRQRAIDRGLSLNEYELTGLDPSIAIHDEADIYRVLGMDFVPPEMREDTGEVELAVEHAVPKLITDADLRGVFHNHTTYSDGSASLEEMALAARQLGFEYFGVADHSQSLVIARGLSPAIVRKQWAEIDQLNKKLEGITILKGTEVDILEDGSLDFDDELLAGFDYVVASIHTLFGMPEAQMTARVCKALEHPALTMLGHCTGRLLLRREGYKIDLEQVLQTAARNGKMIEINAQPSRLELDWIHVKRAKALGIPIVINTDAHSPGELNLYHFGIQVARRGWLTRDDVFNTRPLADVRKELARRKKV